jgi:hypothetical protein
MKRSIIVERKGEEAGWGREIKSLIRRDRKNALKVQGCQVQLIISWFFEKTF